MYTGFSGEAQITDTVMGLNRQIKAQELIVRCLSDQMELQKCFEKSVSVKERKAFDKNGKKLRGYFTRASQKLDELKTDLHRETDRIKMAHAPRGGADLFGPDVERWFAGELTRQRAEKILAGHPNGSYLVRKSVGTPDYAVSVRFRDEVRLSDGLCVCVRLLCICAFRSLSLSLCSLFLCSSLASLPLWLLLWLYCGS